MTAWPPQSLRMRVLCQVGGVVERAHAWRMDAAIRPRSETSSPWARAQARISAAAGPPPLLFGRSVSVAAPMRAMAAG